MTWFLLRIRFERFEAMDTRREADWVSWRRGVDEKLHDLNGSLLERVNRMERDVGTHDTGMRKDLHDHTSALLRLDGRVSVLEKKL